MTEKYLIEFEDFTKHSDFLFSGQIADLEDSLTNLTLKVIPFQKHYPNIKMCISGEN